MWWRPAVGTGRSPWLVGPGGRAFSWVPRSAEPLHRGVPSLISVARVRVGGGAGDSPMVEAGADRALDPKSGPVGAKFKPPNLHWKLRLRKLFVAPAPPGNTLVPPTKTLVPPGNTFVPPAKMLVAPGTTFVPPATTFDPITFVPAKMLVNVFVPPGTKNTPPGSV